jgi:hypothetical protein
VIENIIEKSSERDVKMPWIAALQLFVLALGASSFNLESRLPIYKFDRQTDSYFGYSVAIHHEESADKKW